MLCHISDYSGTSGIIFFKTIITYLMVSKKMNTLFQCNWYRKKCMSDDDMVTSDKPCDVIRRKTSAPQPHICILKLHSASFHYCHW